MNTDHLATTHRTHPCGSLRSAHVGQTVRLGGWVHRTRDLGGLLFIDLRDRDGIVQVSVATAQPATIPIVGNLSNESVILVEGRVVERPEAMRNSEMPT